MTWRCVELLLTLDGRVVRCRRREWWHRWFGLHRSTVPGAVLEWARDSNTPAAAPTDWSEPEEVRT